MGAIGATKANPGPDPGPDPFVSGTRDAGNNLSMPTQISRAEVQRLVAERHAQLVDALSPAEFDESHIVGAVNVPLTKLPELAPQRLDLSRPIITYCNDFL